MKEAETPAEVFRLGRRPDPWAWPNWAYAEPDGTFGNRFDDPLGIYRVLYASTQRLATFVECLAYFRPDVEVIAELAAITGDADDGVEPPAAGIVPREWVDARCVGRRGSLASTSISAITRRSRSYALHWPRGSSTIGSQILMLLRSVLPLHARFTRDVSRFVFEQSRDGTRRWNGLAYLSKHGDDLQNWTIFEPASPDLVGITAFADDDPDLAAAATLHGLTLD